MVGGARAVRRADYLSHQLNKFVYITVAVRDQILAKLEGAAAGLASLLHELDKRSVVKSGLFLWNEVREELVDGTGICGTGGCAAMSAIGFGSDGEDWQGCCNARQETSGWLFDP